MFVGASLIKIQKNHCFPGTWGKSPAVEGVFRTGLQPIDEIFEVDIFALTSPIDSYAHAEIWIVFLATISGSFALLARQMEKI